MRSKKRVRKIMMFFMIYDAKIGCLKWQKEVFAFYVLQFKRCRWSRKSIESGAPSGVDKSSKLKPWAAKVDFLKICMDFGKLAFLMFFRSALRQAKITNKSTF